MQLNRSLILANNVTESIMYGSLFTYISVLLFPHTNSIREIAFWLAFVFWLMSRFNKKTALLPLNHINIALLIFVFIGFIASVTGPGPLENVRNFKSDLLIPAVLFFIIATEFDSEQKIKGLLYVMTISSAVYALFTLAEFSGYGLPYLWADVKGAEFAWKMEKSLYFPVVLGIFLLIKSRLLKSVLIIFALFELVFIMAGRAFSVLLGVIPVFLLWMVFAKPVKYRLWMLAIILILLSVFAGLVYYQRDHPAIAEYKNKYEKIKDISQEFKKDSGLTDRIALWRAGADIVKERPLLGYGWGENKYKELVRRADFDAKWKTERPYVYALMHMISRRPHNIFIDLAIQSGLLGVVSFLLFLAAYVVHVIKSLIQRNSGATRNFLAIIIGGVISIFMISNLLNSEFGNVSGKVFFIILGAGAAWMRLPYEKIKLNNL
jgi:O-antigen ligase